MSGNLDIFGWEMLYKLTRSAMKTKQDVLICLTHWTLIRRGFRCGGLGYDPQLPQADELSELLPEGWNSNPPYKLRYVYEDTLYLLCGMIVESGDVIINLNRTIDEEVNGISFELNEIKQVEGTLSEMIPTYLNMIRRIHDEVLNPFLNAESLKDSSSQTSESFLDSTTTSPTLRNYPNNDVNVPVPMGPQFPFGGNIGIDDFMPLGGIGGHGGMLFQGPGMGLRPNRPDPGMPRGALPPGARYDPIRPMFQPRPSSSQPTFNPDYDHMPPPGSDDMFM